MKKRCEIFPLRSIAASSGIIAYDSSRLLGDTVCLLALPVSWEFKCIRQSNVPVYIQPSL